MIELVQDALDYMNDQLKSIETSLLLLSDEQIWTRIKPGMNSIGNYCLHLAGNEYQYFVTAVGGRPLIRERSREFFSEGGLSRDELVARLKEVRSQSEDILSSLSEEDLNREVTIPYDLEDWNRMKRAQASEEEAKDVKIIRTLLVRISAHYGFHTGQIVLLAKMLSGTERHISGNYH
ncbi:putative damage-inducible protein DinB [Paenibacillus forsythiae]|uniref:Damage-inducible protein DinB n=1 Tax=Paenibacillus forsythiae TaxID=365616 RepID=A0ABU3H239_9BACL|nr:DUF1572 family protein [Paenibacillus forsythiae]MDT3424886.1 putative damage-inducible protein DinB [Paenibacillus forsythiae]